MAINLRCPACYRLLAKSVQVQGAELIHVIHRGYELYTDKMLVRCIACGQIASVDTKQVTPIQMEELNLG